MQPDISYRKIEEEKRQSSGDFSSRYSAGNRNREELAYRIEKEISSELQPPLQDMMYGMARSLTDTIYSASAEQQFPTRKESMDYFDKQFMGREIRRVKGNLTQYVRDAFGTEDDREVNNLRRNVYRKVERYGLGDIVDEARPWKNTLLDDKIANATYLKPDSVENSLASALSSYKEIIQPSLYDSMSSMIKEKAPVIAERLAGYMPTPANRLNQMLQSTEGITNYKEASHVFEKQLVYGALEAAGFDKNKAAGYLGDSLRTLNRRIEELGIDAKPQKGQAREAKVVSIEDSVKSKDSDKASAPENAVNEMERFQQLVIQYNSKRESERKRKDILKDKVRHTSMSKAA
ncbi:MAG: helix-turn-helix domain-containing protein [Candidatus Woesearchaeota archaeon]